MRQEVKTCLACGNPLQGRSDKRYCDVYCKSRYQYEKYKQDTDSMYFRVSRQLRLNRKLLKRYNRAGKATIRAAELNSAGFDPRYFTHYWKNSKGDVYRFVYEFGFLPRQENGKEKFILITWQPFMER